VIRQVIENQDDRARQNKRLKQPASSMTAPRLVEQLINNICGKDSLGNIYHFLPRTYGKPAKAMAEFERYLEGNWSPEWIEAARLAVEEQQHGCGGRTQES
jgi:hypothetical protein